MLDIVNTTKTGPGSKLLVFGCWSTRTFTNSYFGQLVPNKLVLYFSLVNSYFMPLVNSYFLIGQLVLLIGQHVLCIFAQLYLTKGVIRDR